MRKVIYLILLSSLIQISSLSMAGISGSCGDTDIKLSSVCTNPYQYSELGEYGPSMPDCSVPFSPKNNLLFPQKRPYLFYYAIDTTEPLMLGAIDYEIKKLRQTCNSDDIYFVAFTNGLYKKGTFVYCGVQNYRYKHIKSEGRFHVAYLPRDLSEKLSSFEELLLQEDNSEFSFPIPFAAGKGSEFAKYPLSHPDFFASLFSEVKDHIFPAKRFTPFIHIKSHGSNELVMTAPTPSALNEKVSCQEKMMAQQGTTLDITAISSEGVGLGALTSDWEDDYNGSFLGIEVMLGIEVYLGIEVMLGAQFGQGIEVMLGSSNHFGLSYQKIPQVITHIADYSEQSEVGFIMYESCESNLGTKKVLMNYQSGLPLLRAHYSAVGSLWYRNLDWHTILSQSNNAGELQEALLSATRGIPNFITGE